MRPLAVALLATFTSFATLAGCGGEEPAAPPAGSGGSGGTAGSGGRPAPGTAGTGGTAGSGGSSAGTGGSSAGTGGSTAGSGGSTTGTGGAAGSPGIPDAGASRDAAGGDGAPAATPTLPGLVKIFDGTSWDSWEYDPRCWTIVDGAMHGHSPGGQSQAFTKESYSNFRLILWMRMVASNDHLGVCLWGDRPAAGRYGFGGCLLVIPPSGAIWDYRDNTDNPRPGNNAIKYMFHQVEILANRTTGKVRVAVNGKLVHDYQDDMLARRKHGPIGMQIHRAGDTEVEYKDIQVEVDPKEDRLITLVP